MSHSELSDRMISRRQWVGLMSVPALAATMGALPAAAQDAPAGSRDLGTRTYNIPDFGAVGDGKALDTAAVQNAIDACTKDHGGVVLVPAGTFLIGAVELKSN